MAAQSAGQVAQCSPNTLVAGWAECTLAWEPEELRRPWCIPHSEGAIEARIDLQYGTDQKIGFWA